MSAHGATILIVDDDRYVREGLREILHQHGYEIEEAYDGKIALDYLGQRSIDLMLLDLDMPRVNGMEVLRRVAADFPEIGVVIISGKGTIQLAVEATKLGAYDFLEKPLEMQRTLLTVRNAVEKLTLIRQRNRLVQEAQERYQMVGTGPAMQRIYHLIDRAAMSQSKVLIMGENGTGKELIARAIHHNGPRRSEPFVTVNCAAIPENLIESELFGHQKGAFTTAYTSHRGKFEQADRGTILLDEIGDASAQLQAKILRVLEDGAIDRVGGERPIPIDIQVIAATNKNITEKIAEGSFREDLYYRLNVITIEVPPLRERREDIPLLVDFFMKRCSEEKHLPAKKLERGVMKIFLDHDWPGNIRELRNTVERMIVLSDDDTISTREAWQALKKNAAKPSDSKGLTLHAAREQFEREFILNMLISNNWKILETANAMGIERTQLWKKMKQYGIEKQ
ncbi:MAG: sigma-54 dependent transcriptional regulator [candidate division KSB1 bacterium]|nr:sigma-54 dependent transcriptional regulator [candidate division KSB1 bacterium]